MKTLILIISLVIASSFLSQAGHFGSNGPTNRVVLFATNYLLKLYPKDESPAQQVSVPELQGYTLKQVAVVKEIQGKPNHSDFDYVAVYQQKGSRELRVVLYNHRSEEQLSLGSIRKVAFENDQAITRIVMQKSGQQGQLSSETLLLPGTLQVARLG